MAVEKFDETQTRSDRDVTESMRQPLRLIREIRKTSRWRLVDDEISGWSFTDGRGYHYDGWSDDDAHD